MATLELPGVLLLHYHAQAAGVMLFTTSGDAMERS